MVEPIVSREHIRVNALAAANGGQDIDIANPHPAGTAAFLLWELHYWAAVGKREVVCF